jgi:dipeptidyl aminopeptidase/acylaminoacyl peptidase
MVVVVHDGPARRDSLDYDALGQVLATRGFMVFKPNYRGSGGYGRGWARAGDGQWDGVMASDVTDGVKALVAAGRADPDRICIAGGGYGGYAALHAGYSEPDLYRCIIAWAAPSEMGSELRSLKKRADASWRAWAQSVGEADEAALKAMSPQHHAAAFQAPVLLIHGSEDDLVPHEQSKQMAAALQKAGKTVTLLTLDGEGHADFGAGASRRMFEVIADFVGRVLSRPGSPGTGR